MKMLRMEELMLSFLMLACANMFLRRKPEQTLQVRYKLTLYLRGGHIVIFGAIATVFIASFLLTCGDVESNPGPATGKERSTGERCEASDNDGKEQDLNSRLSLLHHDIVVVTQTIARMESASQRQGQMIQDRLISVEDKIDRRLKQIEETQNQLATDVYDLQKECQTLTEENIDLKGEMYLLQNKCDYLDNQSRRNNLLFFGLPLETSWEKCEQLVKKVIREGLCIDEEIHVERAHRAGKAVIVRFLSFKQKSLVLSQARRLRESELYHDIYIREDFSATVQKKRKALLSTRQDLISKGEVAKLRFDKLVTKHAVYKFDPVSQRVTRSQTVSGVETGRSATGQVRPGQRRQQQHHADRSADLLLPVEEYPPLPSRGREGNLDSSSGQRPQTNSAGQSISQHDVRKQLEANGRGTGGSRQQQRGTACPGRRPSRERSYADGNNGNNTATRPNSKYNLRARVTSNTEAAKSGAEGVRNDTGTSKAGTRTPTWFRGDDGPTTTPRGFGRGRGRTPPSQTRIDSMFRLSHHGPAPESDMARYDVDTHRTDDQTDDQTDDLDFTTDRTTEDKADANR